MPFALVIAALELTPGKADFVEFDGKTVDPPRRRDRHRGLGRGESQESPRSRRDPALWLRRIGPNRWNFSVAEPAVDLDGDGTRDVLVVVTRNRAFLALSGKDGSMLWNHVAQDDGSGGPRPEGPELPGPVEPASRPGGLIGLPAIEDVDGDGTPDVIATMVFKEFEAEAERRLGTPTGDRTDFLVRRMVQAISGRSGRWIWTYPIDPTYANPTIQFGDKPAVLTRGRRSSAGGGPRRHALAGAGPEDRPAERRPDRPGLRAGPPPPVRRPRRRRRARDHRAGAGAGPQAAVAGGLLDRDGPPALDRDGRCNLPESIQRRACQKNGPGWSTSTATAGPR